MSKQEMTESEIRGLWDKLQETLGDTLFGAPLERKRWTFKFSRAKTQLGTTQLQDEYVAVSRVLVQNGLSKEVISDTIRQEIAHAIDYEIRGETGHGPEWKKLAKKCGANPERTTDLPEEVSPRIAGIAGVRGANSLLGDTTKDPRATTTCAKAVEASSISSRPLLIPIHGHNPIHGHSRAGSSSSEGHLSGPRGRSSKEATPVSDTRG